MDFAIYTIVCVVYAIMSIRFMRKRLPNRVLIQCLACGSKLYQYPSTYRWGFVDRMLWALVAWVVVFRHHPPLGIMIALVFVLMFTWAIVVCRIVHAYFVWRHPFRCQGGGHTKPAGLLGRKEAMP